MKPKLSIIAYDGGFRERFFQIDSLAKQTLDSELFEYIWVEYFDSVSDELQKRIEKYPELNTNILTYDGDGDYSLDKCVNYGVDRAVGEIVVVLDADTYLEPNVLEETLAELQDTEDLVLYVHRHDEPTPMLRTVKNITLDMLRSRCELLNDKNYGGYFATKRENYIHSGGYEEHPIFSGPNHAGAMDLKIRFENMGLNCRWHPDLKTYHVHHENAQGKNRWNGFRVESQWRIIDHRKKYKDIFLPLIGIHGRYRELGQWWYGWLSQWDNKSIGYQRKSEI